MYAKCFWVCNIDRHQVTLIIMTSSSRFMMSQFHKIKYIRISRRWIIVIIEISVKFRKCSSIGLQILYVVYFTVVYIRSFICKSWDGCWRNFCINHLRNSDSHAMSDILISRTLQKDCLNFNCYVAFYQLQGIINLSFNLNIWP